MNVANRKLFTNRDARAKLSSMGGIMASSPELLGEVQKFETGGDVQQSMSDMFTPVQLGESIFYVDMQSGTVLDSQGSVVTDANIIEAVSIQAVERAQASNAQAPTTTNESVFSSIGDTMRNNPLRDAISAGRETMAETQKQRDLQEFFSETLANQQQAMPGGAVVNSSLLSSIGDTMRNNPLRDAIATGRETMAETQKQKGLQEFFSETLANQQQAMPGGSVVNSNLLSGNNFSNDPTTGYSYPTDIVAEPVMTDDTGISSLPVTSALDDLRAAQAVANVSDGSAGLGAAEILAAGENYLFGPRDFEPRFLGDVPSNLTPPSEDKTVSEMSISELEAEKISRKKPISSFFRDTFNSVKNSSSGLDAAVLGALGTAAAATGQEEVGSFLFDLQKEFETLKTKTDPESRKRKLEIESSVEEVTNELDRRNLDPGVGGPEVTLEAVDKAVEEAEKEKAAIRTTRSFDANKVIKDRETAAAEFADEEVNRQGPNFIFDPEKIQKVIDEGGSVSDSIIGDATGTNQNLSPKDSVKAYQAMYKEMLGMDDEDEEKEKWHQMAMIGFAIAAGQDPNALSNIAGGLLEGTKMARKDRMRKKDRDDKFTMMAIQSADEDRRTALAAGVRADERSQDQLNRIALTDLETRQRLKDESRKSKQSLQLYEDKLKIAEMFKTPKSILKTDPALANIKQAYEGVDYDMLGTGETAFSALEKMGFPRPQLKRFSAIVFPGTPYGGSADVGKGVTGTNSTLVFE